MISERVGRTSWRRIRRVISGPDSLERNTERAIAHLSEPARRVLGCLCAGGMREEDLRRVLFDAKEYRARVDEVIVELFAAGLIDSDFPDYQFIRPELLPTVRLVFRERQPAFH
jgi:hypothetical protein